MFRNGRTESSEKSGKGRTFDEFFKLRWRKRGDFSGILNGETVVVVVLFERSKGLGENEEGSHLGREEKLQKS